jgi:hypothetical protein
VDAELAGRQAQHERGQRGARTGRFHTRVARCDDCLLCCFARRLAPLQHGCSHERFRQLVSHPATQSR